MIPTTATRCRARTRRISWALALPLILALCWENSSVRAGESGYRKCTLATQACLDAMVGKLKGRGWLGIEYDDTQGPNALKVTRVIPASPAEIAGFKPGDLLISVNGIKYTSNSAERCVTCESTREIWKPGRKVEYVVRRGKKALTLRPTLAPLPPDVQAQMIGMHMLDHAEPLSASASAP